MIDKKTLTWNYYLKKLPLYLQNSYGFSEHFKILYQIMVDTNTTSEDLLRALNLTNENYFNDLNINRSSTDPSLVNSLDYTFDLLDKMAALYGVSRYFDVDYIDESGKEVHKALKLNNDELLKLILVRVVQNDFLGTYEDIRKLYNLINLPIYLYSSITNPATAYLILDSSSSSVVITENIRDMFLANLLTIKSMGIQYIVYEAEEAFKAYWDSEDTNKLWDKGEWW